MRKEGVLRPLTGDRRRDLRRRMLFMSMEGTLGKIFYVIPFLRR